jgi:hypothetical protein
LDPPSRQLQLPRGSAFKSSRVAVLSFPANSSTLPATTNTAAAAAAAPTPWRPPAAGGGGRFRFQFQFCFSILPIPEEDDDEAMVVSPVVESLHHHY